MAASNNYKTVSMQTLETSTSSFIVTLHGKYLKYSLNKDFLFGFLVLVWKIHLKLYSFQI